MSNVALLHAPRPRARTAAGAVAVGAVAAVALVVEHRSVHGALVNSTAADGLLETAAGLALAAAAALTGAKRPREQALLFAAAAAWFVAEWNNPGSGSALVFTAGLSLGAAAPAVVAHAVLAFPGGRLRSRLERVAVAAAYVTTAATGVVSAGVFDPARSGCSVCPQNLLLVHASPRAADRLTTIGVRAGAFSLVAVLLVIAVRLARSRAIAAVLLAGAAFVALALRDDVHSWRRGFTANDPIELTLRRWQAVALLALSCAVAWSIARARRARARVAEVVVELGRAATGDVRNALAATLGDPALELAFADGAAGLVDAEGKGVELPPDRALTPVVSAGGARVATVVHGPAAVEHDAYDEVISAARLAIEHAQLEARLRAHLAELQRSSARIVATGDAHRRRLERDLHDGAQQRLIGLLLELRLLAGHANAADAAQVEAAIGELQHALAELRELATGLHPVSLSDGGLAAALADLAERTPARIERDVPAARYPDAVEVAVYLTVAEAATGAARVTVRAAEHDGMLVVDVSAPAAFRAERVVELADRARALGGSLSATDDELTMELPCAS